MEICIEILSTGTEPHWKTTCCFRPTAGMMDLNLRLVSLHHHNLTSRTFHFRFEFVGLGIQPTPSMSIRGPILLPLLLPLQILAIERSRHIIIIRHDNHILIVRLAHHPLRHLRDWIPTYQNVD